MKLKVTKPVTSQGRYYAMGDIVEMDENRAGSYRRLYGWSVVTGPDLSSSTVSPVPSMRMKLKELRGIASTRGVAVPANATKKDILKLIGE